MDQATELRRLVLQAMRERTARSGPAPRLLVCCGGSAQVGVTTVALNVSLALAEYGARPILVDADPRHSAIGRACGISPPPTLNCSQPRRDIHELLIRGPGGLQLVPSLWGGGDVSGSGDVTQQRLVQQLRLLGRHADLIVVDAGGGRLAGLPQFWQAADEILLLCTPAREAVMDTYALLKRCAVDRPPARVQLIVNRATPEQAVDVYRRLQVSCRRFLDLALGYRGALPEDPWVAPSLQQQRPLALGWPQSAVARGLEAFAAELLGLDATGEARTRPAA